LRIGVALRHHGERLVQLGIDAGGAQERFVGLFVVRFQARVLDVARALVEPASMAAAK
jgi:hypothetical protein